MNNDVALEKHVIALNESLIKKFKGFIFRIFEQIHYYPIVLLYVKFVNPLIILLQHAHT
jgi:hypothetical protein